MKRHRVEEIMKLILLTSPTFFIEEDKILTALFNEGLDRLHLYKPKSEPIYSERLLTLLPERYRENIVVHENFYLKNEFGLRGIHYDNDLLAPEKLPKGKVSATCRSLDSLKMAKKKFDYVFLRNIFDSQSEDLEKATFSMQQLEEASEKGVIDKHVYALGGMNEDTLRSVKRLGFGGVVMCGDLWNRFDVHNAQDYKNLISHFNRMKRIIE